MMVKEEMVDILQVLSRFKYPPHYANMRQFQILALQKRIR